MVYRVVGGTAYPVWEAAGYAPLGFGYRRSGREQLSVEFVTEILRKVSKDHLSLVRIDLANPERLPVGPVSVVDDNIGFQREG